MLPVHLGMAGDENRAPLAKGLSGEAAADHAWKRIELARRLKEDGLSLWRFCLFSPERTPDLVVEISLPQRLNFVQYGERGFSVNMDLIEGRMRGRLSRGFSQKLCISKRHPIESERP